MTNPARDSDPFRDSVAGLGAALLGALETLEVIQRSLHPPALAQLRQATGPARQRLEANLDEFQELDPPDGLADFAGHLGAAGGHAAEAMRLFCEPPAAGQEIAQVLGAMRAHCLSQEALFPLHRVLPPVSRFFLEPGCRREWKRFDPDPPLGEHVGFHDAGNHRSSRGKFTLYVPETVAADEPRPLIVALHGGSGHGADFLWTWLREARSRRCLLLAPTSQGSTWSLHGPDLDAKPLRSMVAFVAERFPVDPERVLLTGLSDGGTYTLLAGLQPDMPFTALAPISGVLAPMSFASGNLSRAEGRRIYLVHGALDWMFPVAMARMAREELTKVGADLVYREIEDLSHTYPREENARILDWLEGPGARTA